MVESAKILSMAKAGAIFDMHQKNNFDNFCRIKPCHRTWKYVMEYRRSGQSQLQLWANFKFFIVIADNATKYGMFLLLYKSCCFVMLSLSLWTVCAVMLLCTSNVTYATIFTINCFDGSGIKCNLFDCIELYWMFSQSTQCVGDDGRQSFDLWCAIVSI